MEIDNHRRQEQLKLQKESELVRKNSERSTGGGGPSHSNYAIGYKEDSPIHAASAHRPKAKVAPRVKSSASNNGENII